MVGGYTGSAKAVREVQNRDRKWRRWKIASQLVVLIQIVLASGIVVSMCLGELRWPWIAVYWGIAALKHTFEFLAGRLR